MADVVLSALVKKYDDTLAVRGIDLEIEDREFVVLVGPSGCGKSTTLRMVAGLEEISGGRISIGGRVVNDVPPKDRDIAMVFQNYALYPHMTVAENMAFGLKLKRTPKDDIARRIRTAAETLDIADLLERRPKQLSGGQRQRVAMGRAMVRDPQVFLYDEPLSNLDAKLRVQMRTEMKKLRQTVRTTTIYVTHDQVEAMTLADRVVVMNDGLIEQVGPPTELYHAPKTKFVSTFIGSPQMNLLPCALVDAGDGLSATLASGLEISIPAARVARYRPYVGKPSLLFGIRPEHLTAANGPPRPGQAAFEIRPEVVEAVGMETLVYFSIGDAEVCCRVDPSAAPAAGAPLMLHADVEQMHLVDDATGLVV